MYIITTCKANNSNIHISNLITGKSYCCIGSSKFLAECDLKLACNIPPIFALEQYCFKS